MRPLNWEDDGYFRAVCVLVNYLQNFYMITGDVSADAKQDGAPIPRRQPRGT